MKYVVFKSKGLMYTPVIIPEHMTHSQVSIENEVAVSAGFFYITSQGIEVSTQNSESLKLGPADIDKTLLAQVLNNSNPSFFINYDEL